MSYRYRRVELYRGRWLWKATPIRTVDDEEYGMDTECRSFIGLTRSGVLKRARRWGRRQNQQAQRCDHKEVVPL